MLVRRLAVVGLVLGLFLMHGLAHSGPDVAAAHVHGSTVGVEATDHCDSGPCDHGLPLSHELCQAVVGAGFTSSLVGGSGLPGAAVTPLPVDQRSPPGRAGEPLNRPHPPDFAALCVLRI